MTDPRLGWTYDYDPANQNYHVNQLAGARAYAVPKSATWDTKGYLDQGNIGSCVGNGFCYDLMTEPHTTKKQRESNALNIYHLAQTLDPWADHPHYGTSVLAGAKASQQLYPGNIDSYHWAFTMEDLVATLGYIGPVVLGVTWYESMYNVDSNGFIKVDVNSGVAGGHCIMARGVDVVAQKILLRNSWGRGWGIQGECYLHYEGMQKLLSLKAEMCVVLKK